MVDGVAGGAKPPEKTWVPDWDAPVEPGIIDKEGNRSDPEKRPTDNIKPEDRPVAF